MPASYPTSVKVFTTKTTGQIIEALHVNEIQDEVTAIEQGLLQGLAHHLIPDAAGTRDVGSATRTWRDILAKRFVVNAAGESWRVQVVGTDTWLTVNAYHDGTNWVRDDTAKPARAIVISGASKDLVYYYVGAGANPIMWAQHAKLNASGQLEITPTTATPPFVLGTNAQGQLVIGLNADTVDNQHLTDLDARYVNTTGDTMTGALSAPTVVAGTDPGGTEALRAQNAKLGATTLTGQLSAPTIIAGTDPGGTEELRASSARLQAPVLLGSVPQFTVAADPTAPMHVATKQYVDNFTDSIVVDLTSSSTLVIINLPSGWNQHTVQVLGCVISDSLLTEVGARINDDQTANNYTTAGVELVGTTVSAGSWFRTINYHIVSRTQYGWLVGFDWRIFPKMREYIVGVVQAASIESYHFSATTNYMHATDLLQSIVLFPVGSSFLAGTRFVVRRLR